MHTMQRQQSPPFPAAEVDGELIHGADFWVLVAALIQSGYIFREIEKLQNLDSNLICGHPLGTRSVVPALLLCLQALTFWKAGCWSVPFV